MILLLFVVVITTYLISKAVKHSKDQELKRLKAEESKNRVLKIKQKIKRIKQKK